MGLLIPLIGGLLGQVHPLEMPWVFAFLEQPDDLIYVGIIVQTEIHGQVHLAQAQIVRCIV